MPTFYFIYKTTNTINNRIYIGSHSSHTIEFDGYFGSGKNIITAIKKYGENSFTREILEIVHITDNKLSQSEWNEKILPVETKWLKYYSSNCYDMYNINKESAFGGNTTSGMIWAHDPETLQHKMIEENQIPENWVRGRSHIMIGTQKGKFLYTNNKTKEEKYFVKIPLCGDWVRGSSKQTEIRKGKNNPAHGKKWYQNKITKEYCYNTECPINFETGHPDWKYNKDWKSEGWVKIYI